MVFVQGNLEFWGWWRHCCWHRWNNWKGNVMECRAVWVVFPASNLGEAPADPHNSTKLQRRPRPCVSTSSWIIIFVLSNESCSKSNDWEVTWGVTGSFVQTKAREEVKKKNHDDERQRHMSYDIVWLPAFWLAGSAYDPAVKQARWQDLSQLALNGNFQVDLGTFTVGVIPEVNARMPPHSQNKMNNDRMNNFVILIC